MRIFTVGLSIFIANEMLPEEWRGEKAIELMDQTAADMIVSMKLRKEEE